MNILLWVMKILLAAWCLLGGSYTLTHYQELGNAWALGIFPKPFWLLFAGLEIAFAIGLIIPGVFKTLPKKTSYYSAIGITILFLLAPALFIAYKGFPGVLWGIIPALFAAFIAYKEQARMNSYGL